MKLYPIPNWPHYFISKTGSVFSTFPRANTGYPSERHELSQWLSEGYPAVTMSKGGKSLKQLVHRLLLETFVGAAPSRMEALHRNGKRNDLRLANLHWGTRKENQADRLRHGTDHRGEKHGMHKLTTMQVVQIRSQVKRGDYHSTIASRFGVHKTTVSHIAQRHTWAWLKEAA